MRTEDMWITMTFIQMAEAVLDPQLMHAHPYGELPVCCVHELSTSGAVSNDSWATVLRMMRRFAKPNAAPSSKGGGGGGVGGGGPSGLGSGSGSGFALRVRVRVRPAEYHPEGAAREGLERHHAPQLACGATWLGAGVGEG